MPFVVPHEVFIDARPDRGQVFITKRRQPLLTEASEKALQLLMVPTIPSTTHALNNAGRPGHEQETTACILISHRNETSTPWMATAFKGVHYKLGIGLCAIRGANGAPQINKRNISDSLTKKCFARKQNRTKSFYQGHHITTTVKSTSSLIQQR